MAVSRVTLNHGNIGGFFQASPFAGSRFGSTRGFGGGRAENLAARMALAARINADARFNQRTSSLVSSVVPIVRSLRGGGTEIGVGTTVEHGKWLEIGTREHIIEPKVPFRGKGRGGYLLRSNGRNSKGFNPTPLHQAQFLVQAPALSPRHWMSDAVRSVVPGSFVRVRVHK